MRVDRRARHDGCMRSAAVELFEQGSGYKSAAKRLSVSQYTVRKWLYIYRAFGSEVLLSMDGKRAGYGYEQKVAAASAVVDGVLVRGLRQSVREDIRGIQGVLVQGRRDLLEGVQDRQARLG